MDRRMHRASVCGRSRLNSRDTRNFAVAPLVEAVSPRRGEVSQRAAERAVLALAAAAAPRVPDAIALRVAAILQHAHGSRLLLVAQSDSEGERSNGHGEVSLAGPGDGGPHEISTSATDRDSLSGIDRVGRILRTRDGLG